MCFLCRSDGSVKKDLFLPSAAMKRRKKKIANGEASEGKAAVETPKADVVKDSLPGLWKQILHIMAVPVTLTAFMYLKRRLG